MEKGYGILVICAMILVLSLVGTASAATWSVDGGGSENFTRIQEAINDASDGDTILVHSGVYNENVVVDKLVTLKGIGYPVVDAGGEGNAITLCVDLITVEGFNVTNSGSSWWDAGIEVISSNNTISGNNAGSNSDGIVLRWFGNNHLYLNNFINDTDNVYSYNVFYYESTNIWNSPMEISYIYGGTAYTNCLGNYWDDYEGSDTDRDGIGNKPYSIDSKKYENDDYPLMMPFENYIT